MIAMTRLVGRLRRAVSRFRDDRGGQIAIIFALSSTLLVSFVFSGIDLSRAYLARQKLSQAATLTCQYSTRLSVTEGAFANYVAAVNAYAPKAISSQNWTSSIQVTGPNQAGTTYYSGVAPASGSASSAIIGQTEMNATVPMTFLQIVHVPSIRVRALVACQTPPPAATPAPGTPGSAGSLVVSEGFETPCSSYCFTNSAGQATYSTTPVNTFPSTAAYVGSSGGRWYIMGYCLETDIVGVINSATPEGTHSGELDCDNGSGSKGNSSISTKVQLQTGYYELRYFYRARVDYGNYDPAYVCGSTASDVAWANDGGNGFNGTRTNQINAYLDADAGGKPPFHTTIDGTQSLAGSSLVDVCVYSPSWVERSVKIKVTTSGIYWLSFAADGNSDSYGGQLDNIRLCVDTCNGTPQDNFPPLWLAANNSGVNKVLFEDTFETPTYAPDYSNYINKSGNLYNSTGITTTSRVGCYNPFGSYPVVPGWYCQAPNGWGTAPLNQVNYFLQGAQQGSQYIALDGYNGSSPGTRNRIVSRPFLLDPGYYQVKYNYMSSVDLASTIGTYGTFCTAAPNSGYVFPGPGTYAAVQGKVRFATANSTTDGSTNILGMFMSHGALVSTPNIPNATWATSTNYNYSTTPAVGSATTYTNPDGSVTTTPAVPPDTVSWASYNANVANPVLDACGYADSYRWIARSVSVKITKPGVYWLTFSGNGGTADGNGAGIDDVTLTALGSPYMTSPPIAPLVAIPVPAPQPDSNFSGPSGASFTGFYIVADPFKAPAANQ